MKTHNHPPCNGTQADEQLDSALERISEYCSGDAENAAHLAMIRELWDHMLPEQRTMVASKFDAIVAESEDVRY